MKDLIFTIGKYKGAPFIEIWKCNNSYAVWFLSNVNISKEERNKALNAINTLNKS